MYVHTFALEFKNIQKMKKIILVSAVAFATLLSSFKPAEKTTWSMDKAHA